MSVLRRILVAACLCVCVRAQERIEPPVLIKQVDPDYGGLTAGYLVDTAEVRITLDARGVPFALNSSVGLPDNVVEALSRWRYRPYKKNGQDAACEVTMKLPVRRAITPFVERHIRPAWAPKEEAVREAVEKGRRLSAEEAASLENDLPRAEALGHPRTALLIYYAQGLPDAMTARARRARLIEWLIENYPDDEILGSPAAIINASGEPLADGEARAQAEQLWLKAWTNAAKDPTISEHAVNFLRTADPARAVQILLGLDDWALKNAWIGNVYGLAALGVSALNPGNGRAVAVDDSAARTKLAQSVRAALLGNSRKTGAVSGAPPQGLASSFAVWRRASAPFALLKSDEGRVVLSAMATVESARRSLAKAELWTPERQAFCERLLEHTKQIYAATITSCDAEGDTSEDGLVDLRMKGNVAPSLRKKSEPHYPSAARSQHIEGTVKLNVVINETGRIEQVEFMTGPLVLMSASEEAVRQWKFKPAERNGRPVAIEAHIEVNFRLGP